MRTKFASSSDASLLRLARTNNREILSQWEARHRPPRHVDGGARIGRFTRCIGLGAPAGLSLLLSDQPKRERLSQACTTSHHHQPLRHHWPLSPKLAFSKAKPCGLPVALLPSDMTIRTDSQRPGPRGD